MDLAARVRRIVSPSLEAMGYDVVRVQLSGSQRPVLQVMAERLDRAGMTVDDCAEISRTVSALLDVEDPIPSQYTLEVSSPGIDRPLVRLADFERFAGFDAKVELRTPVDGCRRFQGRLGGVEDGRVRLAVEDGAAVLLPFDDVQRARLLLTDELLAAARAEQERAGQERAGQAQAVDMSPALDPPESDWPESDRPELDRPALDRSGTAA